MAKFKNVDLSKFSGQQAMAIEFMALPGRGGLSYEEIAEKVGISSRQFYRWRQEPEFKDAVVQMALINIKDDLPDVFQANIKNAKKGNAKHIELIYKLMGMLVDMKEVEVTKKGEDNDAIKDDIKRMRQMLKEKGVE